MTDQLAQALSDDAAHGVDAQGVDAAGAPAPAYRHFLDALGVAAYTVSADGVIGYFNAAAVELWGRQPEPGERWCGSLRLYWPDGRLMRHDESPMAICLHEERADRRIEAVAERPDNSRVSFMPYLTRVYAEDGTLMGAIGVLVDTSDRVRAEEALQASTNALAASSAVKDDFLGLVSHELRTPVTTIFGNARLLRDRAERLPPGAREGMVADIAAEAERLLDIVENLLLMTRLGSGVEADPEPQVLNHVVRRQVDSYRSRHPRRPVIVRSQRERAIVEADAAFLEVLLENLISNADKYSPPGEPIEVAVSRAGDFAEVGVRDRGIGLDEGEAEQLFSPFYRGSAARSMGNGVGIGLTVCRRLAELLGGRMWARPRRRGGSEFGFSLPLAAET